MAMIIRLPTHPLPTPAGQTLTPRGAACAHLIRFDATWQTLSRDDRRWFAETLGRLAAEAVGADRPPD
jgi:hypothetical protein